MCNFILYIFFISIVTILSVGSLLNDASDPFLYNVTISDPTSINNLIVSQHEFDILPEDCMHELEVFMEKATNLTRCTVLNARPIRVCVNCEEEIKIVKESYEKLKSAPPICQQQYFESDQVGIINLVYNQGETVWTKSNCENCYEHRNDTEQFFTVSKRLDACIDKANKSSSVNNTCLMCHDIYVELNEIYNKFVNRISTYEAVGVCMDIVDQMNITRHRWSNEHCVNFDSSIGYPNIVTAVLVGAMPIFFYMLSKNISIIEDVKLVRQKRKSFASMPSE